MHTTAGLWGNDEALKGQLTLTGRCELRGAQTTGAQKASGAPGPQQSPKGTWKTIFSSPHQKPGQLMSYRTIETHLSGRRWTTPFSFSNLPHPLLPLPRRLRCHPCLYFPAGSGLHLLILQGWPVDLVLSKTPLIQTSQTTLLADLTEPPSSWRSPQLPLTDKTVASQCPS